MNHSNDTINFSVDDSLSPAEKHHRSKLKEKYTARPCSAAVNQYKQDKVNLVIGSSSL